LRNDGRVHLRQQEQCCVERRENVDGALHRVGAQRGQVAPGHEAPAVATQHHGAHTGVSGDRLHGGKEGVGHGHVDGVERLGPVETQRGYGAVSLQQQGGGRVGGGGFHVKLASSA
jgi:hypothetical protein